MTRPVEVLLHHMPTVERRAENEWVRMFARSILKQARNRFWRPSPKQRAIMERLVAELFNETDELEVREEI